MNKKFSHDIHRTAMRRSRRASQAEANSAFHYGKASPTYFALVRLFLILAIATHFLGCTKSQPAKSLNKQKTNDRPNIILISLDTVRPDHLGCYGYNKSTSPNLDRFASQNFLFKNARSQAPWTLPSHMSLFTSMLPSHHGVDDLNKVLSSDIPVLAEILKKHGYHTAALVNNGQMMAHWGFSRGFDLWREFRVDTPEGNCKNITQEALKWLSQTPAQPFFLFLHYYDPHLPYDPPEPYKKNFNVRLSGLESSRFAMEARFPNHKISSDSLTALINSYDAEIAWLDHEIGKLLNRIPHDTSVIIFSDHGEAFKEHDWMLHGATLYEEEIRAALIIKPPEAETRPLVIEDPVMLIDVAPTLLDFCKIDSPVTFEGANLRPLLKGETFQPRTIFSETRAVIEGRIVKMAMLYPWKLCYSLFDGSQELYKLPNEKINLVKQEPAMSKSLFKLVQSMVSEMDYWIIYAKGSGEFEASLQVEGEGHISAFIPIHLDPERDSIELLENHRGIYWRAYPAQKTKALFIQLDPIHASIRFDCHMNGARQTQKIYLGSEKKHPQTLPFTLHAMDLEGSPHTEKKFEPTQEGFHIIHHAMKGLSRPSETKKLDDETIQQLRSLGYLP